MARRSSSFIKRYGFYLPRFDLCLASLVAGSISNKICSVRELDLCQLAFFFSLSVESPVAQLFWRLTDKAASPLTISTSRTILQIALPRRKVLHHEVPSFALIVPPRFVLPDRSHCILRDGSGLEAG
jgi:hypothetical protein